MIQTRKKYSIQQGSVQNIPLWVYYDDVGSIFKKVFIIWKSVWILKYVTTLIILYNNWNITNKWRKTITPARSVAVSLFGYINLSAEKRTQTLSDQYDIFFLSQILLDNAVWLPVGTTIARVAPIWPQNPWHFRTLQVTSDFYYNNYYPRKRTHDHSKPPIKNA